ncbi:Light-harvesting complex I polypeptide [Chondrus crispus]|uniref:Light-harvesting complex I polypeptide n=1 Tax=Chondrus crispus TaxID=2769 RepID=R7QQX2_CHOCR|nr:Light-harvesting complex I polypeptide [Chondrus crispus]CDF39790.1 Light-harvesting complex I polypeptide [Chondrus crispus]|eukprot:XP_005710084.1 Light-harvesting complex I polypeptide [Chondrus crispus]
MFAFVSSFTAFRPSFSAAALSAPSTSARPAVTMVASRAIPFLEAPSKLDGSRIGDSGFDPLYLSDYLDQDYAAAGELKNGRVAMLATVGMLVQEFVHLPNPMFAEANPIKAIYAVPVEGWVQILVAITIIELATFKKTYESGADLGFDPLGMGSKGNMEELKLKELKNGRLAMLASIGFIFQTITTGKPIIAQLTTLGQ